MVSETGFRRDVAEMVARMVESMAETRAGAMFGYPAFFTGRKMFACVYGAGVALRLPDLKVMQLHGRDDVSEFRPHGRRMRNWVHITRERAVDYQRDARLLRDAARFARQLSEGLT